MTQEGKRRTHRGTSAFQDLNDNAGYDVPILELRCLNNGNVWLELRQELPAWLVERIVSRLEGSRPT